jgi:hypothetical protein
MGQEANEDVDISPLFSELRPFSNIRPQLNIQITDHTYLPKTENVTYDWVHRVAIPAFQAYRGELAAARRELNSFCTLGTGTGSDALAAIEILLPRRVVMTDIHADIVKTAVHNVRRNLKSDLPVKIDSAIGNVCSPLLDRGLVFDLIYENLPNLPLGEVRELLAGQNSSSYYKQELYKNIPDAVHQNRLTLHYVALVQARSLISKHGSVLCSMGTRCPTAAVLDMVRSAGYKASPLVYTWKMQSEPHDIITGYAAAQHETGNRFVFYRPEAVRKAFEGFSPEQAARNHAGIEQQLASQEIDAVTAQSLMNAGVALAHTVMVVNATLGEIQ